MAWKTFSGQLLRADLSREVETRILKEQQKGNQIRICIGTDSQANFTSIHFASVIVFVREKQGGFMLVNESRMERNGMKIKERLIMEVGMSVQIAYQIDEILQKYRIPLEIHADINVNEDFLSNSAMKEALGYIKGMGYDYKLKPEAFASSSCADKYV